MAYTSLIPVRRLDRAVRYVRTGGRASRGEQRCAWVLAAALVGYGVLRNLM